MPRGGGRGPKKNYKGKSRHFTDEESLKQQAAKEAREKEWRKQRGEDVDEEEEEGAKAAEGAAGAEGGTEKKIDGSESESESSTDDEDERHKGVSHLIAIENPNRALSKTKKIGAADDKVVGPQLTRREREEIDKQRATENYRKLHQEGKTEEARNDMARLAIIRKQREDAAKKRAAEMLAKDDSQKS